MTTSGENAEALFDKALEVADRHLDAAIKEAGALGDYVIVGMIEAAVNRGVEVAGHEDIVDMLRDLAQQIENDMENEDADDDE